jgi:hypothetical protein
VAAADVVSADCNQSKQRLDDALTGINKYFGDSEEELVELAEHSNADYGKEFNRISDECSNYFESVSSDVAKVQNGFIKTTMGLAFDDARIREILMLKNPKHMSDVKI